MSPSATTAALAKSESGTLLSWSKASADELRLDVLRVLSRDSFGVLELSHIFDCSQSGMSHHLKQLANAGLVTTRREGNSIYYRRAYRPGEDPLRELQQALFRALDQQALSKTAAKRLKAIQDERAANSQLFFAENADKFSKQQEQIASYELYGPSALELLTRCKGHGEQALEVGPGEGDFLAELSPRFSKVFALDNSEQMLGMARSKVRDLGLKNIRFIHGDTRAPALKKHQFDCVVINMVLHHTPSPADIFQDLAAVMKPGAQLFVTELCHHDQDWARSSCGDLWLGFEPEDLSQWAENAGLYSGENTFLAQRNGFRVQIWQFLRPYKQFV